MRAELPPNHPLPADCEALQPQPAETIALCPLMYSEWLSMSDVTSRLHTAETEALQGKALLERMFTITKNQTDRQRLYESRKYCAPEIIAAVARDEAAAPVADDWPRYCSPLNIICRVAQANFAETYRNYQARLLNANRYLRAFELLNRPDAALPPGYSRDGDGLTFTLHQERADIPSQTITLPLPGSRMR